MGRGKAKDATDFWKRYSELTSKDLPVLEATGIPKSTLATYRSESRYPRADEARDIANALGTTVEYLVSGVKPKIDTVWVVAHADLIDDLKILTPEEFRLLTKGIRETARERREQLGKSSTSGQTGA